MSKYINKNLTSVVGIVAQVVAVWIAISSSLDYKIDSIVDNKVEAKLKSEDIISEFESLADGRIYASGLVDKSIKTESIWKDYLKTQLNKQVEKYEKDPEDVKEADIEFLINHAEDLDNADRVKLKRIEAYLSYPKNKIL